MKTIFTAAAALVALTCYAQAGTIKPSQALANAGQLVIIEGTASIQTDSARAGIDVTLTGSDNGHMTAFIPQQSRDVFPALDGMDGKTVDVTGVVLMESGRPEIRLMRPNQLKLATP